ncbi:hypothetical protein DFH28DRAFT_1085939 [Melampsora americana]|nr:hypothetical protein DFH28DRAFT_1085939 [Melampsora americana]
MQELHAHNLFDCGLIKKYLEGMEVAKERQIIPDIQLTSSTNHDINQVWSKLEEVRKTKHSGFLISLDEKINYGKLLCSIGRLRGIMDIFEIDQENLPKRSKKDEVVRHYRKHASPMVDEFVCFLNQNLTSQSLQPVSFTSSQSKLKINGGVQMANATNPSPECSTSAIANSNSTPTSSPEDLQAPKRVNKFVSHGFSKGALIKLQAHVAESTGKVWCPQLWIPLNIAMSQQMLLPTLCQGIHFNIFPMEELEIKGDLTF